MHKPQILFIEDNDSVREAVTRQLEALGMFVTALSDGDLVKHELSQKKYDLVIADLHLPNCSGFDIARFANARKCKIILLSGDAHAAVRGDYLTDQFDEILIKPVTLQSLKTMLIRHGVLSCDEPEIANSNYEPRYDISGAIDLNALEEQMGHLDDAALQMLSRFPNMMRTLTQQISDFAARRECRELSQVSHSLKGAARSAGAMNLGIVAENIQTQAEDNQIDTKLIQILLDEFAKVEKAIQDICRKNVANN